MCTKPGHYSQNEHKQINSISVYTPEIGSFHNLFIPGILVNIWWKIGCLKHLIRNILGAHNGLLDHLVQSVSPTQWGSYYVIHYVP